MYVNYRTFSFWAFPKKNYEVPEQNPDFKVVEFSEPSKKFLIDLQNILGLDKSNELRLSDWVMGNPDRMDQVRIVHQEWMQIIQKTLEPYIGSTNETYWYSVLANCIVAQDKDGLQQGLLLKEMANSYRANKVRQIDWNNKFDIPLLEKVWGDGLVPIIEQRAIMGNREENVQYLFNLIGIAALLGNHTPMKEYKYYEHSYGGILDLMSGLIDEETQYRVKRQAQSPTKMNEERQQHYIEMKKVFAQEIKEQVTKIEQRVYEDVDAWLSQKEGSVIKTACLLFDFQGAIPSKNFEFIKKHQRIVEQLLSENKKATQFAFRIADLLELDGDEHYNGNLLGTVKNKLKEMGVSASFWKQIVPNLSDDWMANACLSHNETYMSSARLMYDHIIIETLKRKDFANLQVQHYQALSIWRSRFINPHRNALIELDWLSPDSNSNSFGEKNLTLEFALNFTKQETSRLAIAPYIVKLILTEIGKVPLDDAEQYEKLSRDVISLRDYLQSEGGQWGHTPKTITWNTLLKRSEIWHEMVAMQTVNEKSRLVWNSVLLETSMPKIEGYTAKPLTNGGQLFLEGKAMHHCVSSYAEKCMKGTCRIFSLMKDGERVATLELVFNHCTQLWSSGQLLGPYNSGIKDANVIQLATSIELEYNAAFTQKKNQESLYERVKLEVKKDIPMMEKKTRAIPNIAAIKVPLAKEIEFLVKAKKVGTKK